MPKYNADFLQNPKFNTVLGLTNTTFDTNNIVSGRMITEQQLHSLWQRIYDDEQLIDRCCRDIILWESHVQIVRLNTNAISGGSTTTFPRTTAGGVVTSFFAENVKVGITRRGLPYTVEFPIKWDKDLYVPRHTSVMGESGTTGCQPLVSQGDNYHENYIAFYYAEDAELVINNCPVTTSNRSNFLTSGYASQVNSVYWNTKKANLGTNNPSNFPSENWYSFFMDVADDGIVTIRDNRRNTNFNIIRWYTQWTLNRCADGSLLSDTLGVAQQTIIDANNAG